MNDSIELLKHLVSFPTISSRSVLELAADLAQRAEDIGFTVYELKSSDQKSNILATIGPQEDSLVLSGHMDVVPTTGQSWSGDPFKLRQVDDRLIGRGSCDMKGFIASTMSTLKKLDLSNLKRGIALAWTHDEEVGCIGAQQMVSQIKAMDYILPKSILIGEPTGMTVSRMHGGHATIEIKINGTAAHSSKPHLGCSAISFAARLIMDLEDLQEEWKRHPVVIEDDVCHPLLHVAQMNGGEAVNVIPASCSVQIGLRAMPLQDSEDLTNQIKQRLYAIANQPRWSTIRVEFTVPQDAPPLYSPSGSELECALKKHGCTHGSALPFSTDGGWFAKSSTIPLICGPGQIDIAHKPDEYISINDLNKCDSMLEKLLLHWTAQT